MFEIAQLKRKLLIYKCLLYWHNFCFYYDELKCEF